ncbi:hypothetical protein C0966_13730 [Bacillus methanolicus]|uniref:hypothetical protein n=1 Tax=Bacillus methanolicus TaxID=1471 RepID=UPI0023807397|nr:hypothetical protein [Bacillus methanolicus]MDE3840394.1 hypothetical protein [Bacillus methanolicus]
MKKILALSLFDLKYAYRDFMLMVSILAPLLLALIFRFGIPFIFSYLEGRFSITLKDYSELQAIILMITVPVLLGMFAAFIILDERDENVLTFLAVTPLSKKEYLAYRLGTPVFISTLLSFAALFIAGYADIISWRTIPVILLLSLEAPLVALFVAGTAKNKVEGLAVAKVASILLLVPLMFDFIEGPWKYIAGMLPPFWLVAAFFSALHSEVDKWLIFIGVSLCAHLFSIWILFIRFKNAVL